MQKWGIAVCGLVSAGLALSVSIAVAAEIKSFNLEDDHVEISISGNIAPGDADVLKARIIAANDAGKQVTSLRLNFDGGNLLSSNTTPSRSSAARQARKSVAETSRFSLMVIPAY